MRNIRSVRSESGFTLVEIVVAIGIMMLLILIAVPIYLSQRTKGYEGQLQATLSNAAPHMEQSRLDNNGSYPEVLPATVGVPPEDVAIEYVRVSPTTYCLQADIVSQRSHATPKLVFHITQESPEMVEGIC